MRGGCFPPCEARFGDDGRTSSRQRFADTAEVVAKHAKPRHTVVDRNKNTLRIARGAVDRTVEIAQRTIERRRAVAVEAGIAVAVKQRCEYEKPSHPDFLSDRDIPDAGEPL